MRILGMVLCFMLALQGPVLAFGCSRDAMLVFDGSGSMQTRAADAPYATRLEDAQTAMARVLPRITRVRRMGLVVYGPGPDGPCDNVTVRVQPKLDAALDIQSVIGGIVPGGDTPLTRGVEVAADVLLREADSGIVVLVTDGRQTCSNPCLLADDLAAQGNITVHVVGFKIDENFERWPGYFAESGGLKREPFRCLADQTGGIFVVTNTVDELAEALDETLGCSVVGSKAYRPIRRPV